MMSNRRSFVRKLGAGVTGLLSLGGLSAAIQSSTSPSRRPKLRITDVQTAFVRALHVRITTDQGVFGDGEGVDAVSGGASIVSGFRPALIGQDPLNVDALFERIRTSGIFAGAQAGQYVAALSAVEIALWDLAGKALGLPIYQLLGGKMRDQVRIYCDSATNNRNDPKAKEWIAQIIDLGFTAAKIDIDDGRDPARFDRVNWTANNAEIDHMIDKVAFMRESLPAGIDLAVDMHGRYDLGTAKRVARLLEPFRLLWLEEPVPPENVDAMRDVRESCHVPICAGENLFLRHGFRELLEKRAVDIVMPDIQKCGGLLEARKIADMAHTYYVPMAPHCQASPIGMMASCHVLAAIPNALVLEWHWGHPAPRMQQWKVYVKEGEIIQKGFVTVPDRPGIGLELDEEAVKRMLRPGAAWFAPKTS
ncbi:MAG: mandelate racemase/muconate lactonizing enzyme family protein [Acidobacteria bacterium]|nr:MAG: mandelate racemase/muconate lactonizing enzyme family protein [Acidobacteriota bacterium]